MFDMVHHSSNITFRFTEALQRDPRPFEALISPSEYSKPFHSSKTSTTAPPWRKIILDIKGKVWLLRGASTKRERVCCPGRVLYKTAQKEEEEEEGNRKQEGQKEEAGKRKRMRGRRRWQRRGEEEQDEETKEAKEKREMMASRNRDEMKAEEVHEECREEKTQRQGTVSTPRLEKTKATARQYDKPEKEERRELRMRLSRRLSSKTKPPWLE
jgi:hypothetical protein